MLKAKIITIKSDRIVATGEEFIEAVVEFTRDTETYTKKLGYPVGTTKKEILADIKKHLETDKLEAEQRVANMEVEAQHAHALDLKETLEGEELTIAEPAKKKNERTTKKK